MRLLAIAAPLLMIGYGVARLIDGIDGTHGPGPAWTIGHVMFLACLVLFGVLMVRLARSTATKVLAGVGLVGLFFFVKVVVIDIVVGFEGDSRAEMSALSDKYGDVPGWFPNELMFTLAPILFQVSLLLLMVLSKRLPFWSPLVALLAVGAIGATLDLLPLAGVLFLIALLPLARGAGDDAVRMLPTRA